MDTPATPQPPPPGPPELPPDHLAGEAVDYRKIVLVGLVSLIIFAIGVLWAYGILRRGTVEDLRGPGSVEGARAIGQAEIGIVDQVPFDEDNRLEVSLAVKRRRLESFGWVSRELQVVHVPIEVAMKLYLEGARPGPPATGTPGQGEGGQR